MPIANLDITNTTFNVADWYISSNNVINELNVISLTYANTAYVQAQLDDLDSDIQDGLNLKLDITEFTANNVLTLVKAVDGIGSGLDSDFFQGQPASFYLNATNINQGTLPSTRLSGTYSSVQGLGVLGNTSLNILTVTGNTTLTTLNVTGVSTFSNTAFIWTAHGPLINTGTAKTTMVDADALAIMDSEATNTTKKVTFSSLKTILAGFFGKKATVSTSAPSGGSDGDIWYQV